MIGGIIARIAVVTADTLRTTVPRTSPSATRVAVSPSCWTLDAGRVTSAYSHPAVTRAVRSVLNGNRRSTCLRSATQTPQLVTASYHSTRPVRLGLIIALPLLAFIADIMGLFGAGLVSWVYIGIPPQAFIATDRGRDRNSGGTAWAPSQVGKTSIGPSSPSWWATSSRRSSVGKSRP